MAASPPLSAPSLTPSFDSLPQDLLGLILCYIPQRPRLLVASRVCKRWRNSARNSVHSLCFRRASLAQVNAILPTFPRVSALTSFDLLGSHGTLNAPSSLRSLVVGVSHSGQGSTAAFNTVLSLTSLSLCNLDDGTIKLLCQSVSTLTSLDFHLSFVNITQLCDFSRLIDLVEGINFPQLTALKADTSFGHFEPMLESLVTRHATQLTSLALPYSSTLANAYASLSFPKLTSLSLRLGMIDHAEPPLMLARCSPSMCLSLSVYMEVLRKAATPHSRLTQSLTHLCFENTLPNVVVLYVKQCSRLTSLSLHFKDVVITSVPKALAPVLTSALFWVPSDTDIPALLTTLAPFTRLHTLKLKGVQADDVEISHAGSLPSVSTLSWETKQPRSLRSLSRLLHVFPSLCSLTIDLLHLKDDNDSETLQLISHVLETNPAIKEVRVEARGDLLCVRQLAASSAWCSIIVADKYQY